MLMLLLGLGGEQVSEEVLWELFVQAGPVGENNFRLYISSGNFEARFLHTEHELFLIVVGVCS